MSLKSRIREHFIRKELESVERKQPMIRKALDWLTDPTAQGRKRSIAAACACVSVGLRYADKALVELCETAVLVAGSTWCSINPEAWGVVVSVIGAAIQVLEPGMDLATAAFALVGFVHAYRKGKAAPPADYAKFGLLEYRV